MKYSIVTAIFLLVKSIVVSQNISFGGNTPNASAAMEIESTSQGILIPRMTSAQRMAISSPAEGLLVFDTDTKSFQFFQNANWLNLSEPQLLSDLDGDTSIEVERTSDEDEIHLKVGGFTLFSIERKAFGRGRIQSHNILNNLIIGHDAGLAVNAGSHNVFLGYESGKNNTLGLQNTFLGSETGAANSTGEKNTFIGRASGINNTTGRWNTFMGVGSGWDNSTGDRNCFIGKDAGSNNLTGYSNIYLGTSAGFTDTSGTNNVMIGDSSGMKVFGSGNVFIGKRAGAQTSNKNLSNLLYINNAPGNTPLIYGEFDNDLLSVFGQLSVGTKTPGTHDFTVFDGDASGSAIIRMFTTSADQNDVLLGFNDSNDAFFVRTNSNHDIKFQTNGSSTRMTVKNTGDVGIGTTTPSHILHVNGVARSNQSTWDTSSDKRVKKNIQNIESALSIIDKLRPVTFEWEDEYKAAHEGLDSLNYGFIAQEMEKIIPETVTKQKEIVGQTEIDDFRTLNVGPILPILVKAVKEQQEDIKTLKEQNKRLMDKLEMLLDHPTSKL